MVETFANCYASITNLMEISNRLEAIRIDDDRENDEDDCAALERLTKRIKQLPPTTRIKDRHDEAKVRFLSKTVAGTRWGLHPQQNNSIEIVIPAPNQCPFYINE